MIVGFPAMFQNLRTLCVYVSPSQKYSRFYVILQEKDRKKKKNTAFAQALLLFQITTLVFLLVCSVFHSRLGNTWYTPKYASHE